MVDLGVVEEVAVLTEFGSGHPSVALVVEIALLGVGEQAVRFRTVEPQRQVVIVICKKGLSKGIQYSNVAQSKILEHQQMSEKPALRTFSGHPDIRLYK